MRRLTPIVALTLVIFAADAAAQVVTDLPLIGDGISNSVFAINDHGDAVGYSIHPSSPVTPRAAVWRNHVGVLLDLNCEACSSVAYDINESGDIVGFVLTPAGGRGFLWRNGVTTFLPPLSGHTGATARAINSVGIIVGQSGGPTGPRPVRWISGVPEDLGVFGTNNGMSAGVAEAINDSGVIVGTASKTGSGNQAFVWQNGVMNELGTLPIGTCPSISSATGINESGVIVGQSEEGTAIPNCTLKPVRWINGVIEALPSGPIGIAHDINDHGDIVGNTGPPQTATLWRNGEAISLGGLDGFAQSIASDINEDGVIVARSAFVPLQGGIVRSYTVVVAPTNAAPTLNLPSDITASAVSPDGVRVTFSAFGSDPEDGDITAVCEPSSGSVFAIGTTTVGCTATDSGGLDASGSFTVTVVGALQQGQELLNALGDLGPGSSLQNKLLAVLDALQQSTATGNACARIQAFINEVNAQSGKKITAAQAAAFVAAAKRIAAVIGC
jgi:probable HAF family extracellular repeat protein